MCLIAFDWQAAAGGRQLLLASNRDEFWDRPTLPLQHWPLDDRTLLAGRDARAGGSWLGFADNGRVAMLTNVRPAAPEPERPRSRGELVSRWLAGDAGLEGFLEGLQPEAFGGFNLVLGDAAWPRWVWLTNSEVAWTASRLDRAEARTWAGGWRGAELSGGVHALSNAGLDTPWPKARRLAQTLLTASESASTGATDWQGLLMRVLGDGGGHAALPPLPLHAPIDDEHGPPAPFCDPFVHWPERRYGTRSSLLARWADGPGASLEVQEWTHEPGVAPPAISGRWPEGPAYRRASISMWGMPTSS